MYLSLQTVCNCHGYLLFESLHCDRCRSLIPFQLSDESLLDPVATNNVKDAISLDNQGKPAPGLLVPYRKQQQQTTTTGRVRFRLLCPFCNSSTFLIRYFCKRERLYYHIRLNQTGEADQLTYRSIADTQNMITIDQFGIKRDTLDGSIIDNVEDSYSIGRSTAQGTSTTGTSYEQLGAATPREVQIEAERNAVGLGDLEGDFFSVLRNGLFYDTLIQCQDDVRIQAHRCVLGGRSSWFRHLIAEYHETNTNDDYVLQISIDDIHSEVMNEILNFMYTNRCLITLKNAPDLLISSKRFELEKLKKQTIDFLLYRLTVDNAIEMLICAHEAEAEALKLAAIRLINRNAEKIKRTEKWRSFKAQYVDLVPELYENRVEHPAPIPQAFLPDVFSGPNFPSDSIRSLSQLYENPVQKRLETPQTRILPPPMKPPAPSSILKPIPQLQMQGSINEIPLSSYPARAESDLFSIQDRLSPNKETRKRRNFPGDPAAKRTLLPSIRQTSDPDLLRRPVNLNNRSNFNRYTNNQRANASQQDPGTMTQVVNIEPAD